MIEPPASTTNLAHMLPTALRSSRHKLHTCHMSKQLAYFIKISSAGAKGRAGGRAGERSGAMACGALDSLSLDYPSTLPYQATFLTTLKSLPATICIGIESMRILFRETRSTTVLKGIASPFLQPPDRDTST
jgi:hypothetical protein